MNRLIQIKGHSNFDNIYIHRYVSEQKWYNVFQIYFRHSFNCVTNLRLRNEICNLENF